MPPKPVRQRAVYGLESKCRALLVLRRRIGRRHDRPVKKVISHYLKSSKLDFVEITIISITFKHDFR